MDLMFSEASEDQLITVWTLNAAVWAGPLNVQDHVERERTLSQQPASGRLWKTWVLALKDDPTTIVASVETFARDVLVGQHGQVSTRKGYGIASVFTNPEYRNKRMARVLLQHLQAWLDSEGQGYVSVLYSDIGPDFYARLGWKPAPVTTLQIEIDPRLFSAEVKDTKMDLSSFSQGFAPLEDDQLLEDLCDLDIDQLKSQVARKSAVAGAVFAFLPRHQLMQWHLKREDLNGLLIHGHSRTRLRGAIAASRKAWIIWHFDEVEHKMKVQRLVLLDQSARDRNVQEALELLRFAQVVAKRSNFNTMIVWNPHEEVIAAAEMLKAMHHQTQVKIEDRKGSIACVRLHPGESLDGIEWLANEYYAWC